MRENARKRVAILISGRGSNMEALIAAAMQPDYPARIAGVISNRSDAGGLVTAERFGLAVRSIPHRDFAERADHDAAVAAAIDETGADIVCLAGYMRLLTEGFVRRFEGRLLNIHPALLPSFKGIHTHERALAAGVRVHGASVHFVTAGMDEGPIIAQSAVPVATDDDAASLGARVLQAEHRLYPLALRLVADGKATMVDGGTRFHELTAEDKADLAAPPAVPSLRAAEGPDG